MCIQLSRYIAICLFKSKKIETFLIIILNGVILSPLCAADNTDSTVPAPDDGDCGAIGGTKVDRGNRSTRRKSAPVPLCPPQIPHD
jgi:hypothetical protein